MNINKVAAKTPQPRAMAKKAEESGNTITIDIGSVGDVFEKGARMTAGAVTSAACLPKTVLAPTFASLTGNDIKSIKSAEAFTAFGAITAAGGTAGYALASSLGGDTFGKVVFAGIGAVFGAGFGVAVAEGIEESSAPVFNYDKIFAARDNARQAVEGSNAAKRGAAFMAGYGAAAKEGYQAGGKAVDGVVNTVKGGAEFVAGMGKAITSSF